MSRRKAEMVLELVDRATRPARRFIALQQRMGRAVELANRIAQRSSRAAQRATDLYKRAVQGLGRAQDALQRGIRRSNDLIRRQITQMRTATGLMRGGVMGMGRAALMAGGMFAAYAGTVSIAAGSFLGPARQFENFAVQLESIEGSSVKARAAMGWIEDFATRTPLELHQVVEAYQQMKTFGMDPTNGSMMALVDSMAASGKGAEQLNGLVLALGKSWTKGKLQGEEIMMLLERGVPVWDMLAEKTGKNVAQLQKMSSAGKLGRREIQLLIDAMAEKNAGASEKMSRTWDGIVSNLMDWWTRFQRTVMGFGVFDWMKDRLRGILDVLNAMEASGELEAWAKAIADNILAGLNAIWEFGAAAVRFWQELYPWLQSAADALGGWRNLALAVLAIPFRGVILGAAFSLLQFAGGAALAMKALAGIGFGSAMTGVLGFGKALLALANPLNWIKGAFIALRVALISTGIGALVVGLAMAGVWVYNNWSGLKAFFKGFGESFMKSLGPARPLAEGVINVLRRLWDWIGRLVAPLDASAEQWAEWGRSAGRFVGDAVEHVRRLVRTVGRWFGRLRNINWRKLFSMASLRAAWTAIKSWLGKQFAAIWDGLKAIDWPGRLVLDGLVSAWANITDWIGSAAATLWSDVKGIDWARMLDGLSEAWAATVGFLSDVGATLWAKIDPIGWSQLIVAIPSDIWASVMNFRWKDVLPDWDWAAIIPDMPDLGGYFSDDMGDRLWWRAQGRGSLWGPWEDGKKIIEDLQARVITTSQAIAMLEAEANGGTWARRAEKMLTMLREAEGIRPPKISDPDTLLEAARAAEQLEAQFPAINAAATEALNAVTATLRAINLAFAELDYSGEGARLMQTLADGIRSKLVEVQAAAREITQAVRNALPRSATMNIGVQGTAPVQARARGGSFAPGWLLTGENGPELEYRNRGGFVAHNRALRSMMAMSGTIAANANRAPGWLKGAVFDAGNTGPADSEGLGARYLTERNSGGGAPRGPISINMTFNGTVDRKVLPDLHAMKDEMLEELLDRLEEDGRAVLRREHK